MSSTRYSFAFAPRFRPFLRALGIRPDRAWLEVTDDALVARFGPWRIESSLSNVEGVEVTGPFTPLKVIGPHLSLADRGLTLGTNADRAICIRFRDPIPGMEPLGAIRHPGLTLTVEDPEGVAADLRRVVRAT